LVGHHSEGRHRRALERLDSHMRQACESSGMAEQHRSRADGIARQLDTSIYSDDADAVERLTEKRTELEERREWMKSANAYYKKHKHLTGWDGPSEMAREGLTTLRVQPYYDRPFPSYALTNIGARIRAAAKRAVSIPAQAARLEQAQAEAEAAGGCAIRYSDDREYCAVTFAEKPDRAILQALRAAFYHYSGGSWSGPVARLPETVRALSAEVSAPDSVPDVTV